MGKSRFTDPRIVTILQEGDGAVALARRARPRGIGAAKHYTALAQ